MFKPSVYPIVGATLLACAGMVLAQTPATPNPTGVAVAPQTATEAQQKAIPRNDTGTVVRTGPTAADRTRDAANSVGGAATGAMDRTASGTSTSSMPANSSTGASSGQRPARADRN